MAGMKGIVPLSRAMAAIAALIVLIALIGYATSNPLLVQVRPGLRGMSPLTATGLLSLSLAVLAASLRREKIVIAGSGLPLCLAVILLGNHAFLGSDRASPAIGSILFRLPPAMIGRTSIATATTLALLAMALPIRRTFSSLADALAGCALLISGMALLGYLYGVTDLYALPMFNSMALNTATALFLLSLAILFVEPEMGWIRLIASDEIGGATRRQLAFVALPIIAGWALLRASSAEGLGPAVAMALLVIATVVPLVILVLRDGLVLDTLSRERSDKLALQERLSREMADRLDAQANALAEEAAERAKAEAAMYRAQRMEAVGQLTGGIAHDFNNLLMAIRGNLELMQRRMAGEPENLARYVDNAMKATDRGARITGQLLAFSSSQRLDIRSVEVDAVLKSAHELIGSSLGPDIDLILNLQTEGVWMRADSSQLELAILNLAVNARDAMPEGGRLRIESHPQANSPSPDGSPADYVSIRVIDTGLGMSEAVVARAVEPFFTTKEQGKGTGLGLAQVYGFVRQCEGDLSISSIPGEGTTVEILLPRGRPVSAQIQSADTRNTLLAPPRVQGTKVLVIDDDDAVRRVIVDALRAAGFDVAEAADGRTGLAMLDETSPAAIVLDFLMPEMNGAQVARLAQARRPDLPIIFVSGYSDTVTLEGITGAIILRKPFDVGGLSQALNEVLH